MRFDHEQETAALPAATVVLVRDSDRGLEVLMLCRSEQVKHMGGMWVFPGGRVDPADRVAADDYTAARNAAIRETGEEAGLSLRAEQLFFISHWTTPAGVKKRFATWFFVAVLADEQPVVVDGSEISRHCWLTPAQALREQRAGKLRLLPPTYISLLELSRFADSTALLAALPTYTPIIYAPRVTQLDDEWHFLYLGDVGYATSDPMLPGQRHRCIMQGERLHYQRDPGGQE